MAGVRSKPLSGGKYQGWFVDYRGKQRFFVGTTIKAETLRMANKLEGDHREIRVGARPVPKSWEQAKSRDVAEVMAEYVAWGESCGGRGGRPWSAKHASNRKAFLKFWRERLGLTVLADLDGILPRVETVLRELQESGKPGKTLQNYSDGLAAFCDWSMQRGFLADDPLKGLAGFDCTPKTVRRAMTADEIGKLLAHCRTPERRLVYETALASGLRANELRSLNAADLDVSRCGLRLHAEWTKNRMAGFQPLPEALVAKLAESAKGKTPDTPLLAVPADTDRAILRDMVRANVQQIAPGGKLDFHALRVTFTTLVIESGADIKTAQALARHSTPNLTLNTYARTRQDKLAAVAEAVGRVALPEISTAKALKTGTDHAPIMAVEANNAISMQTRKAQSSKVSTAHMLQQTTASFESHPLRQIKDLQERSTLEQNHSTASQSCAYPESTSELKSAATTQNLAFSKHHPNVSKNPSNAISMQLSPDLQLILNAWPILPDAVKAGIVATVNALTAQKGGS